MAHQPKEQFHVVSIKRLQNTRNGNPRFKFTMTDWDGNPITATTSNDAMFSYAIHSGWEGRNIYADLKRNAKSNVITHAVTRCFASEASV